MNKTIKWIAAIAGGVFFLSLAAGVILLAVGVKGGIANAVDFIRGSDTDFLALRSDTLSQSADGVTMLDIDIDAADITFVRTQQSEVTVDYTARGFYEDGTSLITMSRTEDTIKILTQDRSYKFLSWMTFNHFTIEIGIPETYDSHLKLMVNAGTIQV